MAESSQATPRVGPSPGKRGTKRRRGAAVAGPDYARAGIASFKDRDPRNVSSDFSYNRATIGSRSEPPPADNLARRNDETHERGAAMSLGAVILCGGESKRMGEPKAWLPFGGERMLQRVVRLVANVVDDVAVVAAPGQELPPLPASVILARDPVPRAGAASGAGRGARRPAEPGRAGLCDSDRRAVPRAGMDHSAREPDRRPGPRHPPLSGIPPSAGRPLPPRKGHPRHPGVARRKSAPACFPDGSAADAGRDRGGAQPGRSPTRDIAEPEHAGGVPDGTRRGGLRGRGESRVWRARRRRESGSSSSVFLGRGRASPS